MTSILEFAATVIIISVSGVMSPGPLFAANVAYGTRLGWKSGIKMAYGHTLVELPLVILLGIGAISLSVLPQFREYISILGAISLFAFAGLQIRTIYRSSFLQSSPKYGPFFMGAILSALNPFFLIWWFTIGFKLISDSLVLYSFIGIGIMFGFHIWMDYAWLGTVGFLSKRGKNILSTKNYKIFMIALSGILVYFGIIFLLGISH
ncbi:MAG TPA: LysE family transporter [Candidatus Nitrosotalea sp.]|nr:LysE family transporter [Candidatus Nitrosotalea sp.]